MKLVLLPFFLLIGFISVAQNQGWKKINQSKATTLNKGVDIFKNNYKPTAYSIFSLDEKEIRTKLSMLSSGSLTQVNIKFPVGDEFMEFEVKEHSMMQPALQAKYNEIRSYIGFCKQVPGYTLRFDMNPGGLHAQIKRPGSTIQYINSVAHKSGIYIVFDRRDANNNHRDFKCETEDIQKSKSESKGLETISNANDGIMRQYRIAFSTGGEFSTLLLNGTETNDEEKILSVMGGLNTILTRCNEVYESDFAIRLVFPENMDTLIYLNKNTDPYTSSIIGFFFLWGTQGQKAMNTRIGENGYDVGHTLMGVPTGGNAGCIGCVCANGSKGLGATGFVDNLTSDPFIIDYLAHEVGHQFGGNHTFTYSIEGSSAQIEPGSGSTIMGYAGTTNQNDVQSNSDPYFSTASIKQIMNNVSSGTSSSCAVLSNTNNTAPTADAGADIFIPISTPFKLQGNGSDAESTSSLTYGWEQNDLFVKGSSNSFPLPTSTTGPVFRSTLPTSGNIRYFPNYETVLQGQLSNQWEALPSVGRELNFRLTVRDNSVGNGQNNGDDKKVTVVNDAGPFAIIHSNETWQAGEVREITWQVNNTNLAPINATLVNILLSVDNGKTFPYVLATAVANDGVETVTIPLINVNTNEGRVLIEPTNNSFYTISPNPLIIDAVFPLNWVSFKVMPTGKSNAILQWKTANEYNNNRFEIERSVNGINYTKIATVAPGNQPNTTQTYEYTDINLPKGKFFYRVRQVDNDGKNSLSPTSVITISAEIVNWVLLSNPATAYTTIQFNNAASNVEMQIADANGEIMYSKSISSVQANATEKISVSGFAKGMYFITIQMNGVVEHKKLIVN